MKRRTKRTNDFMLCISLLALAFALMLTLVHSKETDFSDKENRALKTKPKVSTETLLNGKYFNSFSVYCADQFPLRNLLLGISSCIDLSLGRKECNNILVVKNNKLISRHDYASDNTLKENLTAISNFIKRNNSTNVKTYIVVAPRSLDVNKKDLPIYFSQNYGANEFTEVIKTIPKEFLITPLKNSSNENNTFYNTDHHWTTHGAYLAYLEIANRLGIDAYKLNFFNIETVSTDFLGTSFKKSGLYDFNTNDNIVLYRCKNDEKISIQSNGEIKSLYDFSALETSDKYRVFLGGNSNLLKIRSQENKPKLLLIKDSFANSTIPFLALHFDIDVIDLRYYINSVSEYISNNEFDIILLLYGIDTLATESSCQKVEK